MPIAEPAPLPAVPAPAAGHGVRRALAVLTLVNLLNYLDRFVISAVLESIKRSELSPSDLQLGALASGFIVVYMVTSPVFGALGDKGSRPRLISLGVGIWSAATALAGLAHSYVTLFLSRAAVGIGEAAYGTISPSLLADYFPRSKRGRIFSIFFAAIPIGSALGYVLGGLVDRAWGWRAAFFVAGAPGLLLALLCLTLPDPPRGQHDDTPPPKPSSGLLETYLELLRNVPYSLTVLGYAAYTFALGGMAIWMPAFLERVRHLPPEQAKIQFGAIVVVTGFIGTFAGGWLGDWLLKRTKQAYLWLSAVATLLAVPASLVAFLAPDPGLYMAGLIAAEVLMFASTGPINSALVNLVTPTERASAVALSIFAIHILGDVPSPLLIGAISDASNLTTAVMVVPVAVLISGLVWGFAALRGERTRQGAP